MSSFSDIGILVDELKSGNQKTTCPKCSADRTKKDDPCLSVNAEKGTYNCHHCGWKGSIKSTGPSCKSSKKSVVVATYDYRDESESLHYQSVRFDPKSFSQRRPDGTRGWIWDLKGVQQVPYRLPELIDSEGTIYIPGGEKDVETLVKDGLTATTNSGGEGNWKPDFNEHLRDRDVVILEDNDEKGRKHGKVISEPLYGIASSIKILRFEDMPGGSDVSDFLNDHSIEDLTERVEMAPLFQGSYSDYFGESESTTGNDDKDDDKKTQAQLLIDFTPNWELFKTPDGELFITFPNKAHEETYPIKSKEIQNLLRGQFFKAFKKPPTAQALNDAIGILEALAQFGDAVHPTFTRVAEQEGNLYLDLCNKYWEVIEITPDGWKIIPNSPVKFIRTRTKLPLPHPVQGKTIDPLKAFIKIPEDQWKLIIGFLLACLKPKGPFPILCIQGEQGSGKSFISRLLKQLIDPSRALLKTLPSNERDLVISAKNNWILAFDNLSGLKPWISDGLCRLSSGGGFSIRELYTNDDEIVFDAQRALILNGIDDIATRADLRDRALIVHLPVISKEKRKDEESILKDFEKAVPFILGGLLAGACAALKNKSSTLLKNPPRMADFAKWVTAAESGLGWESGSFMKAYINNRMLAAESGIEGSLLGQAIFDLVQSLAKPWEGNATELLKELNQHVSDGKTTPKTWPKTPQDISKEVKRLAPTLRLVEIEVGFKRESGTGKRLILLRKMGISSSPSSPNGQEENNLFDFDGLQDDARVTNNDSHVTTSSQDNPLENSTSDNGDKGDDKNHPLPGSNDSCWETSI